MLQRGGQLIRCEVPARFVTTDSAVALSAALDGIGIVIVAEFVASHHLASGALVRVLPAWDCPTLPLHLVTPGARRRPARVQVFMDWAQSLLRRRLGAHLDARRRPAIPHGADALSVPAPASTHPPAQARSPPPPRA
jgi:LysR family transcriptional regulator for bpeEF and oprC